MNQDGDNLLYTPIVLLATSLTPDRGRHGLIWEAISTDEMEGLSDRGLIRNLSRATRRRRHFSEADS